MNLLSDTTITLHDVVAAFCAVTLTITVVILAILTKPIPPELSGILGAAVSWVFRGALDGANTRSATK
jgi:hypothetical protein